MLAISSASALNHFSFLKTFPLEKIRLVLNEDAKLSSVEETTVLFFKKILATLMKLAFVRVLLINNSSLVIVLKVALSPSCSKMRGGESYLK